MANQSRFNPFPGLRPFRADESYLFFGREKKTDELLRRLQSNRFLGVVGASGSGKSSLVRAGLVPALHSGFMVQAGSNWRVAHFRPREDPIGNLARALSAPNLLGEESEQAESSLGVPVRGIIETTLRSSSLGLVESVLQAKLDRGENVLVVVDQFEELFRFKRAQSEKEAGDEARAFVNMLLEGSKDERASIYVVITMRSDYIGDCMEFAGLPEAINDGQYLVPRMEREELRSVITGPVGVGGGEIAPRLVTRLLNEVGDDPDQLPVLQHALMRTWDFWEENHSDSEPIDLRHYERVGGMKKALSQHADEVYDGLASDRERAIAERLFRLLTDTADDRRGIRRPTTLSDACAVCEADEAEVVAVVDQFRMPGRTFLMPPASVTLSSESILDISHESLMRVWDRLIGWVEHEYEAAQLYRDLARSAVLHRTGGGLWSRAQLQQAIEWREGNQPTARWADRYDPNYEPAIHFLEASELQELRRRRNRVLAIALLFLLLLGAVAGWGYLENARLVEKTVVLAEKNETLEVENETLQVVKVELSQEVEGLEQEKGEQGEALEELKRKQEELDSEFGRQRRANRVLATERNQLEKKVSSLENQVTDLEKENQGLTQDQESPQVPSVEELAAPLMISPPEELATEASPDDQEKLRIGGQLRGGKRQLAPVPPVDERWLDPRKEVTVRLRAQLTKEGRVEQITEIDASENRRLVSHAKSSFKRWRYQPLLLNGEPVEGQIEVTFVYPRKGS